MSLVRPPSGAPRRAGGLIAASAVGALELDRLGGLLRRMPWTGGALAIGAMAIAGLPPLNGFASEWMTLQSLLHVAVEGPFGVALAGAGATGAITTRMAPALRTAYEAMPEPRLVAALGGSAIGCSLLGSREDLAGPLEALLPVDLRIPGCPRRRRRSPTP